MMSSNFIPDCVETINVPEITGQDVKDFNSYKAAIPLHTAVFGHKSLKQTEAIYFRTRPEGSESDEIYHVSSVDQKKATRVTYMTGQGKGNMINNFIPLDYDEDEHGNRRQGGAVCTIDTNGEEFFQIVRFIPVEDGVEDGVEEKSYKLEEWTPSGSLTRSLKVSNDSSKLLYSCNSRNGKDMDIYLRYLKDRPNGEPLGGELILEEKGLWIAGDWNADDTKALLCNTVSSSVFKSYILDIKTMRLEEIVLPNLNDDGVATRTYGWFSKTDPNIIYLTTNWMSEFNSVVEYHLITKQIKPITTPGVSGSLLEINWPCTSIVSKKRLIINANVDGYNVLYQMNLETEKIEKIDIPEDIAGQISSLSVSPVDSDIAILVIESVSSPGIIYQLNLNNVTFRPYQVALAAQPNHPVAVPKLIRYISFDGLEIPAFVYLPSQYQVQNLENFKLDDKLPVVIFMHGGPASQHVPSYNPRLYFQYMVHALNVCIIAPNVRGSTGYGKAYMEADDGMKREDSVKDIGSLLDHIGSSMPFLDASRICAMGRSYGGYMTLACLTHYSSRLKCGVETCGISNWVTFLETTADHRRNHRRAEYGDESNPDMREFLTRISPITNADKITIPCFMSHGRNDTRVPFSEFEQMKEILQKNNGKDSVWAFMADNEGHIYRQKSVSDAQVVCMVRFLKHFL